MTKMPSIRRLWTMYKRTVLEEGLGRTKRDHIEVLVHNAFYVGARGVYQALAFLLERGDYEELHRVIAKEGRQIKRMRLRRPPRRH